MTVEHTKIKASNLYFIIGFVAFFLNTVSDKQYNIPIAEFIIFGFVIFEFITSKSLVKNPLTSSLIPLVVIFIALCSVIDLYHTSSISHMIRVLIRTAFLYIPLLIYVTLPDKTRIIHLITGLLAGYIIYFLLNLSVEAATGSSSSLRKLKYIIPTPAVVILFFIVFKNRLSQTLYLLIILGFIISIISLPFIGGRGALISTFIGLLFYLIHRILRAPDFLIIIAALLLPISTVAIVALSHNSGDPQQLIDFLFSNKLNTLSNIERTLALHYSIEVMMNNTLLGIGPNEIASYWQSDYEYYTKNLVAGESPHNYYLEILVPYGVPATFIAITTWYYMYRLFFASMRNINLNPAIAAFACTTIGWIMLYQPVSSITRIDILILCISALSGITNKTTSNQQSSLTKEH